MSGMYGPAEAFDAAMVYALRQEDGGRRRIFFYRKDQAALFMAGIYSRYQDGERFVILTTQANASMQPVHDRMPLLLEKDEVIPWISDGERTGAFLRKVPYLLERRADFEQMSLF